MRRKNVSAGLIVKLAMLASGMFFTSAAGTAQTETVLYSFGMSQMDGRTPYAGMVFDKAGNLYGVTINGGTGTGAYCATQGCGTVFELTPSIGGGWSEKVLHNFGSFATDGAGPIAGMIFNHGNLYGTTLQGGAYGAGTVFRLTAKSGGRWHEKILHSFRPGKDGESPYASLTFDEAGNLYGTTGYGGDSTPACGGLGCGAVFKLTSTKVGSWSEKVVHSFGHGKDGYLPLAGLVIDASGNLYGTTSNGGTCGNGTVFELKRTVAGGLAEEVLHNFCDTGDGASPSFDGLIFDKGGNLLGTTHIGGTDNAGTVFGLSPGVDGKWVERVLYSFANNGTDGHSPAGGLILDTSGNIYGTTESGGNSSGVGTAFELIRSADVIWTEIVLYRFLDNGTDGFLPIGRLITDGDGNFFGTTTSGGINSSGTVFEITP